MARTRTKTARRKVWHREQIKAEVRMRGETLTSLALKHGLNECDCRDALRTRRPEAEAVIAAFINIPASELWPDRYPENGISTSVDKPSRPAAHGLIGKAA